MSILKEKLIEIDVDLIEETIAISPTCQIDELLREHEQFLEELKAITLRAIKEVKARRKYYENN